MVDQPGSGTSRSYKIRGHTRQRRTTKPYARPSQVKRKGLIEKVRDYLTPSWFFGYFQKNEEDIEDSSDSEVDIIDTTSNDVRLDLGRDDGLKENTTGIPPTIEEDSMLEDTGEMNLQAVSSSGSEETVPKHLNLSKYLENNNNGEPWRHEGITVQSHETEDCLTDAPADDGIVSTATSSSSYSSQLKRKPLPSLHTRTLTFLPGNSSLFTTRTAGFSSHPQSIALSRVNMSASTNTVTSLSSLKRPQPVSSTPGFSVSTFVTPVPRIFTNKRTESPFYPGRIAYGGALNSGKRQRRHSPSSEVYQPVRKQRIRAKPLPNTTRVGPTTQTAKRILEALESISSPLKDVHRIPSPLISPSASPLSFTPSKSRTEPPRIGPRVGPRVSSLKAKLLGGPPVEALSSPQIAKVTGINSREVNQHWLSPTPFPTSDDPSRYWLDKSLFSGLNDTVLKTSFPAAFTPKSLPTSLSPGEKTSGKMKCVLHGSKHYSFKNTVEDQETINPLPEIVHAIPLPVSTTKNMSTFLISSNKETELLKTNPMQDKAANESTKNGFVFSTPKTKLPTLSVKEALSRADDEVSFIFSQPISVKTKTNKDMKSKLGNSKTVSNPSISSTNKPSPTQTSLAKIFGCAPGEWDCSTCMVRNKTAGQTCVACGTVGANKRLSEQPEKSEATEIARNGMDLAKKFAPAEGTWDCETCMINNTAAALKCVACNTEKPGTSTSLEPVMNKEETTDLKIKFAPSANTWECGTCMIRNTLGENKCVACTTPKPGFTESNLKEKFAAPTGSWECEICMINNEASAMKCMACENSKPGAEAGASQLTFSFGLNAPVGTSSDKSSSSSSGGFTFGGGAVSTSTSFTIGNRVPESNSGVTFGSGSSATETTTSGFTFGSSSSKEQNTTPQFTFGSGESGNDVAGFTFAGSNKSSSGGKEQSKETPNEDINKVAVQAPLNIAQAAAAGLLDVPGVGNTQLKNKKVSTSQPTFSQPSSKSPPNCPASSLPKNFPDSTTVPQLLSKTTPLVAAAIEKSTTETVKITPFNFNAVASTSSAISSSTVATTNPQNALGEKPANPGFCFGMVQPASKPKTTPFSFGSQSSTDKKVDKPAFAFGTNTGTTTKQTSAAPVFKFGAAEQSTAVSTGSLSLFQNTATTSAVSETKTQTSSLFAFTGDGKAEDKPKQTLFNFGNLNGPSLSTREATPTQAAPAGNAMFNFSAGQTSNADTENHNSLGGEDMEADSNSNHDNGQAAFSSTGNFNFAVQTPANSSGLFGPSGTSGTSGTPGGFTFGSGGNAIPRTFQFGTSSNPNNNTPSGGFNFGPSNTDRVGSSPFLFGSASGNITSNVPTNSSVPAAGFGFNVGTASTPGGFSVGATPQGGQRVIKKAVRRSRR